MSEAKKLRYFIDGKSGLSNTQKYYDIMDPSTGEVIANAPCCTEDEVNLAVEAAHKAFPNWRDTPVIVRVQILFKFKRLLEEHLEKYQIDSQW